MRVPVEYASLHAAVRGAPLSTIGILTPTQRLVSGPYIYVRNLFNLLQEYSAYAF